MSELGRRIVALKVGQSTSCVERACMRALALGIGCSGQEAADPAETLDVVPAHSPEPVKFTRERQSLHGARRRNLAPRQRGSHVAVLTVKPLQLGLEFVVVLHG